MNIDSIPSICNARLEQGIFFPKTGWGLQLEHMYEAGLLYMTRECLSGLIDLSCP